MKKIFLVLILFAGCSNGIVERNEEGDPIFIRNYKNDRLHGSYSEFYAKGKKKIKGSYRDGEKHGKWLEYYETGENKKEEHFSNGLPTKKHTEWFKNGQRKSEENWIMYPLDGISIISSRSTWYQNGRHQKKENVSVCLFDELSSSQKASNWAHGCNQNAEDYEDDISRHTLFKRESWYEDGAVKSESFHGIAFFEKAKSQSYAKEGKKWTSGDAQGTYFEWHENGEKKTDAFYKNAKLHGLYSEWHENGYKKVLSEYKDGKLEGKEEVWHENGQLKQSTSYKNGKEDGVKILFNKDGSVVFMKTMLKGEMLEENFFRTFHAVGGFIESEIYYKDEKLHGIETWWYEDGTKRSEKSWSNGLLSGDSFEWYESGRLKSESKHHISEESDVSSMKSSSIKRYDIPGNQMEEKISICVFEELPSSYKKEDWSKVCEDEDKVIFRQEAWYEDGTKKHDFFHEESVYLEVDPSEDVNAWKRGEWLPGNMQGLSNNWFENGNLASKSYYKDGKRYGLGEEWYEDGTKKGEWNYKDGELHGIHKYFYENGQLELKYMMKDGKENGLGEEWYEDGTKKGEWNYKDGEFHGIQKYFYENGQLEKEWNYKNGKRDGLFKEFDTNGVLLNSTFFKDDEVFQDSVRTTFYENGQLKGKYRWKDGKRYGLGEEWYEDGTKKGEWNYKDDELHGIHKYFYENGQLELERNFKDGKRDGISILWNEDGTLDRKDEYVEGEWKGYTVYKNGYKDYQGFFSESEINPGKFSLEYILYYDETQKELLIAKRYESEKDRDGSYYDTYEKSGVTRYTGQYSNGFKTGQWTWYQDDANWMGEIFDALLGTDTAGDPGVIPRLRQGRYSSGLKTGFWTEYWDKKGWEVKKSYGKYKADKKDGLWEYYNTKGKKVLEERWENGTIISTRDI